MIQSTKATPKGVNCADPFFRFILVNINSSDSIGSDFCAETYKAVLSKSLYFAWFLLDCNDESIVRESIPKRFSEQID